jgi:hypothetical protein
MVVYQQLTDTRVNRLVENFGTVDPSMVVELDEHRVAEADTHR